MYIKSAIYTKAVYIRHVTIPTLDNIFLFYHKINYQCIYNEVQYIILPPDKQWGTHTSMSIPEGYTSNTNTQGIPTKATFFSYFAMLLSLV